MHSPRGEGAGRVGALEGVRVVELGQGVSAPFCAKLLADYGAEVIKVELPGGGDVTRSWGPFPGDEPHPEKSGVFFSLNTNKRGVTLDPGAASTAWDDTSPGETTYSAPSCAVQDTSSVTIINVRTIEKTFCIRNLNISIFLYLDRSYPWDPHFYS